MVAHPGKGRAGNVLQANERRALTTLFECYSRSKVVRLRRLPSMCANCGYTRGELRVLVPGAGLGRLAYDVASLGGYSDLTMPSQQTS